MEKNSYIFSADLLATVSALPKNFELNSEHGRLLYGSEIDKIIKLTGINKRHIAPENLSVFDLSLAAAQNLLKLTNIDPKKIKVLLYVSFTHENNLSGDANKLLFNLNLPNDILTLDIKSACSGFLSTALLASAILSNFDEESYALIVDGDVQSKFISREDRGTYPILADAATASLFKKSINNSKIFSFSKGSGQKDLFIKGFSSKNKPVPENFNSYSYDGKNKINDFQIFMNGLNVYKFVLFDVLPLINEFINQTNCEFDFFVPHQANGLIVSDLSKRLGLINKTLFSLNEYGNVGSCSIPLTISMHIPNNSDKSYKLLISGFGAGLSANVGIINVAPHFKSNILFI